MAGAEREWRLGRVAGLDLSFTPLAVGGTVLLWVLFSGAGHYVFHHGLANAVLGGLLLTLLHWISEFLHQFGHATAARWTGYPMIGVRVGYAGTLGTSLYPPEGELPAALHIRRALGGPAGSALVAVVTVLVALLSAGTSLGWVALLWFLDNLLVFTLGTFLPLGFNDGSTLIYWLKRR